MQTSITLLTAPPKMRGEDDGPSQHVHRLWNAARGPWRWARVASLLGLQPAIALNALAGLALMVPAIAMTPLVRRELSQPPPAPVTR